MPSVQAIQKLGDLYAKQKDAEALRRLLTDLRPLFASIPKAKTAKIVRTIIETIAKVPNSTQLQVRRTRPRSTSCSVTGSLLTIRRPVYLGREPGRLRAAIVPTMRLCQSHSGRKQVAAVLHKSGLWLAWSRRGCAPAQ